MPSLNIIGAGQVGKALGYLLVNQIGLQLNCVFNRTLASGQAACDFIGSGQAIDDFSQLSAADYYLITVSDEKIRECAEQLTAANILRKNDSLFHCSGVLPSTELSAVTSQDAKIASLHPVKSFVDPARSTATFSGTYCGIEGDFSLCEQLTVWIKKLAAVPFHINTKDKLIYHSSLVFASNYLNSLTEIALRGLEKSGLPEELAKQLLQPLMSNTLQQIFSKGTATALSGPIARGESQIVLDEINALSAWDLGTAAIYKSLGKVAVELAKEKSACTTQQIANLTTILN